MKLTHTEELLLHRFLDGELAAAQTAAFEARLAAEPLLRRHLEDARALRAGFAKAQISEVTGPTPSAGFTAGVIAAALRLPSRQEMERDDVVTGLVRGCRRLLIAAAVLFGISLAWHAGLIDGGRSATLEAAPGEVQQEMDRLDALVKALTESGELGGERRGK